MINYIGSLSKKCLKLAFAPVIQKQLNIPLSTTSSKMDLTTIANNELKNATTGEMVRMEDLWKDNKCVIIFLRRWGCLFCRLWATEVSAIAPILKQHNVKLIGVGVEEFGLEEFKGGKYFDGDLYVDTTKQSYSMLGFKRFTYISVLASLLWKESRAAITKGRGLSLGGNAKGDGLQNGGALIIDKNGSLLTHFIQNGPAEHMSNAAILKALNISDANNCEEETQTFPGECTRNL